jgi:hypothetical protein
MFLSKYKFPFLLGILLILTLNCGTWSDLSHATFDITSVSIVLDNPEVM